MQNRDITAINASRTLALNHVLQERDRLLALSSLAKNNAQRLDKIVDALKSDPSQLAVAIDFLEHLVIENGLAYQETTEYRRNAYRGYCRAKKLLS